MSPGTLYGIGVGPGDPELMTVKGARILAATRTVFAPKAPTATESMSLSIAKQYLHPEADVRTLLFPMKSDPEQVRQHWAEIAPDIASVLRAGEDACFLTLGDTMLYSTYINMIRALRDELPHCPIVTVPGITSFNAAAATASFPIGHGDEPVSIHPVRDDLAPIDEALGRGGTVILMKIGSRLPKVLELIERRGLTESAVFVARAGMHGERIETDLRALTEADPKTGNLSVIIIHARDKEKV